MRTLFVTAPFGRYDMGGYGPPAYGRPVSLAGGALGYSHVRGDLTSPPDMSGPAGAPRQLWLGRDFATDGYPLAFLGQEADISGLTKLIEDGLKLVPPEVLGGFQDRYKACQDLVAKGGVVGLAAGGKCLSDLYKDIEKAMKHPTAAPPPMAPPPPPPAAPFPILPVAIAVVGAGALVFGLTRL